MVVVVCCELLLAIFKICWEHHKMGVLSLFNYSYKMGTFSLVEFKEF